MLAYVYMQMHPNIAYRIHHVASLLERRAEQLLQEQFGIGFSQFKILMALKWKTNVQQRQIAESLGQTEASVSRQIKMMHEQGLLANHVSAGNRRQRITSLSLAGDKMAEAAMKVLGDYQNEIFSELTAAHQKDLVDALQLVHQHMCSSNMCNC